MFEADQTFILAVTKALNALPASSDYFYLHVELRNVDDHSKIGQWSDEIASTDWYFEEMRD